MIFKNNDSTPAHLIFVKKNDPPHLFFFFSDPPLTAIIVFLDPPLPAMIVFSDPPLPAIMIFDFIPPPPLEWKWNSPNVKQNDQSLGGGTELWTYLKKRVKV